MKGPAQRNFAIPAERIFTHVDACMEKVKPDVAALFTGVDQKKAGSLIVHGWVMAEDLLKLGAR